MSSPKREAAMIRASSARPQVRRQVPSLPTTVAHRA